MIISYHITHLQRFCERINRPIREIYFLLRKRKKNCATSSLVCRVSVNFCAVRSARKETRWQNAASYFFRFILQKRNILQNVFL